MPTGQTDNRTDGRTLDRYIMLSAMDVASVINKQINNYKINK